MKPPVWLVDSSIYVFRAWYTWPETLEDEKGNPVNALRGFMEFVWQLLSREQPQYIGFAFDESKTDSYRNEIYPAYKANREPAPESLKYQFSLCREFIRCLGITEFASPRFEADDLIGSWASTMRKQGHPIRLITKDKDLAQLVQEQDLWWEYGQDIQLDCAGIEKKFGVRPDQIADLLAIAGDKVDNIPGVPGIGMVTAAKLLKRFGDIDHLLAAIPQIGQSPLRGAKRIQQLVHDHQDAILLARRLTVIQCGDEVRGETPDLCWRQPDPQRLDAFLIALGLGAEHQKRWRKLGNS